MSGCSNTIEGLFADAVSQYPHAIAVSEGDSQLTYHELNSWVNQAAFALSSHEETEHAPVAILCGHDFTGIVGALAVLKAGRPYTCLAERSPRLEQLFILRDSGAQVLLTSGAHMQRAQELAQALQLTVLDLEKLPSNAPADDRPSSKRPVDIAAIYYTSGTSGHPKGVMRTHRTILCRLQADRSGYPVGFGDNLALLNKLNFAGSCATLFNGLLNGATLHMADPQQMSVVDLAGWLVEKRITLLRAQTALLRQILDIVPQSFCFSTLRYIRPSGRLLRGDVQRLWHYLPEDCLVGHGLASTEISLATHLTIRRGELPAGEIVPVGSPVHGVDIMIVDSAGQPVPEGEVGEIVVSSAMVSPGYWGNLELTQQKIKQDPAAPDRRTISTGDLGRLRADKLLEFVGRKDNQVKVRGYRIELEAVEAVMEQMPGVTQAAVKALANEKGDNKLVGYVVFDAGANSSTVILRRKLAEFLPDYQIPERLIELDKLPLGITGKVNSNALPDPDCSRPELDVPYVPPQTKTEAAIAGIWSAVLGLESVGIQDNFFDLGGQSLLAAIITTQLNAQFQVNLNAKTLFDAPTISLLAEVIDHEHNQTGSLANDDLQAKLRLLGI